MSARVTRQKQSEHLSQLEGLRSTPTLNEILDAPCKANWREMEGNDRIRWSECCRHFVYDSYGLDRDKLESMVWYREGKYPTRMYRRFDGRLMTKPCARGMPELVLPPPLLALLFLIGLGIVCAIIEKKTTPDQPVSFVSPERSEFSRARWETNSL